MAMIRAVLGNTLIHARGVIPVLHRRRWLRPVTDDAIQLRFLFDGVFINDPTRCRLGIAAVDPVSYYGFSEFYFGNAGSALKLELAAGGYLLLTDITGTRMPGGRYRQDALLSRYDVFGRLIAASPLVDLLQPK
ncbi:hypothetical protein [Pseudomonas fluorescens]|uniref:hypothetical protein n=1 Tax=Pseudomonas fluorescens TaxID=294 RepID=UPI0012426CB0|nr:hypothetical protein [Pseudomonas fluorescens]